LNFENYLKEIIDQHLPKTSTLSEREQEDNLLNKDKIEVYKIDKNINKIKIYKVLPNPR